MSATLYAMRDQVRSKLEAVADEAGEAGEELAARLTDVAHSSAELVLIQLGGSDATDAHQRILEARIANLRAAGAVTAAAAVGKAVREVLLGALSAIPALAAGL